MRVAVYTRKSVYSDTSESTKNQERMCRDYMAVRFPSEAHDFVTYEDEAYTGANTERPGLQLLLETVRNGGIDFLIVYQLDRLSRDIKDFTDIYAVLSEHGVKFASVSETIDTTTPIGETMMYILVIFAQMERKNIAMRVRDNLNGIAMRGWWAGGNPPMGYRRVKITDSEGKKHTGIEIVPEQAERVKWIFNRFLDSGGTLQNFETIMKHEGVRAPRGGFFSTGQLHNMLRSPYCVPADQKIYDYYVSLGCQVKPEREYWTGEHGVIIYGRTTQRNKKHVLNGPENWLVVPGHHEPFIDTDTWLAVQSRFTHNKIVRTPKVPPGLLKGVLRCSCGRLMGIASKKRVDGSYTTFYKCPKRERMGVDFCNMRQIRTQLLDEQVLRVFKDIAMDPKIIDQYIDDVSVSVDVDAPLAVLHKECSAIEQKIDKLTEALAYSENSTASRHIVRSIEKLDAELSEKRREVMELQGKKLASTEQRRRLSGTASEIAAFISDFDNFDAFERNEIARKCISRCTWDGDTLFLSL